MLRNSAESPVTQSKPSPAQQQTASSEVIRDINRRIVLNLIRTRQPISRADLARASGMQRSTISLIVEELIDGTWVLEGPTGRLPRGRRPTYLRLNDERAIIGVDIRPTQTTIALADVNGRFTSQEVMATPADPREALDEMIARILSIAGSCEGRKIEGIGVSLPGRYDRATDRLVFAPNLKWRDVDLRTPIAAATGLEVELENAANACALAAVWFDKMESFRNLVVLTVSEGIGAGVLVNGQLARGPQQYGRRVRSRSARPRRPPLRLRQPRLLGDLWLEPRRSPLLPGVRLGGRRTQLPRPSLPCRPG